MASMMPTFLVLLLCALFAFPLTSGTAGQSGSKVGVVHGYHGNNLPSHQDVVNLAKRYGIQRMRIFGPDQTLFQALQGSNIELVLGVPNPDLQQIANNQNNANAWVQNNVKNYQQNIKFRYIVVGNGVSPLDRDNSQYVQFLMPALRNIQQAMTQTGCANNIKVTPAIDHHELVIETSQPSQSTFRPEIRSFLDPILDFLSKNNAPLLVNLHPFYSYTFDRAEIPGSLNQGQSGSSDRRLDYAIFRAPGTVVQDGNVNYQNAFHAMLDNVYSALEKVGKGSMDVVVSEVGWPTAGANGASQENARAFNNNLLRNVQGTPKRPNKSIEAYIFTMFDENKKGTELQRNWGIFYANQQPKYSINFSGQAGQQNKN